MGAFESKHLSADILGIYYVSFVSTQVPKTSI